MTPIIQGTVTVSKGDKQTRRLQIESNDQYVEDDLEHMESYGFTSEPFPDGHTDALVVYTDTHNGHGIVIVVHDKRYRITNLKPGEVCLFDDKKRVVHLKREGIVIDGVDDPITVKTTGNIIINAGDSVNITANSVNVNAQSTVINSPSNQINGPLTVTGQIVGQGGLAISGGSGASIQGSLTTTGDVVAAGISLDNHTHGGVQAGNSSTSKPE